MKTGIKNSIVALGFFGLFASTSITALAGYFDTAPAPYCGTQITQSLQIGSDNSDVYTLQTLLVRGGYLYATPNGHFGPATRSAVRSFQSSNGIYPTGYVGSATIDAVNERLCDSDVNATASLYSYDYSSYGYSATTGVTVVDTYDAYVKVVSPTPVNPVVYTTPPTATSPFTTSIGSTYNTSSPVYGYNTTPATVINPVQGTNIIYSPNIGYTYGITPQAGSLTITSPVRNAVYTEGDTVSLQWTTNNLSASSFTISIENTSTNQSKVVQVTSGNSTSFVLTKDILDAVCAGACNNFQQGSFKIVISTPVTDIAGTVSTFRAAIAPITINRVNPNFTTVSISASKTPVNSGELFKLYINIPTGASWNAGLYGNYSFKIRAICPTSVTATIAGVACGQDFVVPFAPTSFQQQIPTTVTNTTWYPQTVTYQISVTNLLGQVIGSAETSVTVNAMPINW
jgi:peptidoglycan hydrolase-like protein with peptidoglycan-binding domain